jgi:formylglycine-generating enzyme required for sulfatase activity
MKLFRHTITIVCIIALAAFAVACSVTSLSAAEPRTVPGLELTLMPIPAGSFDMGSIDGDADERLVTRVTISRDFWMGKTEVTQAQWRAIMGSNPSCFKGDDQRPVECLPYDDMLAFCRKLTERERAAGRLPDGYAYALPTEAQWEYACRAGATGQYAGDDLNAMAWYDANSGGQTHPVAQKQANAWGLHDMHGNVWEMCADRYADKLPGGSVRDYTGAPSGSSRISRGGACGFPADACRSSNRDGGPPTVHGGGLGFRLALAPQVSR